VVDVLERLRSTNMTVDIRWSLAGDLAFCAPTMPALPAPLSHDWVHQRLQVLTLHHDGTVTTSHDPGYMFPWAWNTPMVTIVPGGRWHGLSGSRAV
jgi:hypothetical protein